MGKTIIIKGADFSENGFYADYEFSYYLCLGLSLNATGDGRASGVVNPARANVLVPRSECVDPITWNFTEVGLTDKYSTLNIPSTANKITIRCSDSSYYISSGVKNAAGTSILVDGYKEAGGEPTVFDLTTPEAAGFKYLYVVLKIGDAGTTAFDTQTFDSVGLSIVIE